MSRSRYWAAYAWINGQWRNNVYLEVDQRGFWSDVSCDVLPIPQGAAVLEGPVLPGLVNAHSHTFQRAFAGLSERRTAEEDDFWSWRDRMYNVANRITASQMRIVAEQLSIELLKGGYTQVCEFHYLQHDEYAKPYSRPFQLAWEIADAATDIGIGITMLPALYERAGFNRSDTEASQGRFLSSPEFIYQLHREFASSGNTLVNSGVAIHSLRAASQPSIAALLQLVGSENVSIHLHIAEQSKEVIDCIEATGARPIEHLCRDLKPDRRWQLVHAIHATQSEIESVASCGAGIVICPSTEANLGDGLVELTNWQKAGVPVAIGSDSHVSRSWPEELRWLEYGQRLKLQKRNVSAAPNANEPSSAARLFNAALSSGGAAAGMAKWGIEIGARADFLVINTHSSNLLGIPTPFVLDAIVFSGNVSTIREVYVAGVRVITNGFHAHEDEVANKFADVMSSLWQIAQSGS